MKRGGEKKGEEGEEGEVRRKVKKGDEEGRWSLENNTTDKTDSKSCTQPLD